MKIPRLHPLLTGVFLGSVAFSSPATFVTALPVATDQLLIRFNVQPVLSTMGFYGTQFPVNLGYGLTSRWALFVNVNQGFAGSGDLSSAGEGDLSAYARFTLFKIDKPKSTLRIAPLAGAFIPSGSNTLSGPQGLLPAALQTGSGTFDPYLGVTMGYNTVNWGMALDSTYRANPATNRGISPGSEYRADAQVEFKLLPWRLPDEGLPKILVLSLESNYVHDSRALVKGASTINSGGDVLKQDAILELATLHWQAGAGAQIPVMQELPGSGRVKQRAGLFVFFEYYLAAPSWRHRRGRS